MYAGVCSYSLTLPTRSQAFLHRLGACDGQLNSNAHPSHFQQWHTRTHHKNEVKAFFDVLDLEMLASALHSATPIRADNLLQMCSTTVMDLHSDLVRTLPILILPAPIHPPLQTTCIQKLTASTAAS